MENPWSLLSSLQELTFIRCPECIFQAKEEEEFKNHALNCHPNSVTFFDKIESKNEENTEVDPLSFEEECYFCPDCQFKCETLGLLQNHIESTHDRPQIQRYKTYNCEFCKFRTTKMTIFEKHLQVNHKEETGVTILRKPLKIDPKNEFKM